MNIKTQNYINDQYSIKEFIEGVKIFDGVDKETGNPYCCPEEDVKYIYSKEKVNECNGQILLCRNGFHFSLDLNSARYYKPFFGISEKYPKASILNPVYIVRAYGDIFIHQSYPTNKLVTNKLQLISKICNNDIIEAHISHNCYASKDLESILLKNEYNIINLNNCHNNKLFQIYCDDCVLIIEGDACKSGGKNQTIFSRVTTSFKVVNKSKYTQYVNRISLFDQDQVITPIPRHSTIIFEANKFDRNGN